MSVSTAPDSTEPTPVIRPARMPLAPGRWRHRLASMITTCTLPLLLLGACSGTSSNASSTAGTGITVAGSADGAAPSPTAPHASVPTAASAARPTPSPAAVPGAVTCAQYAAMAPDTGLSGNATKEQIAAVTAMLLRHNRAADDQNLHLAILQVIAYCNIYGGHSGSNQNAAIDGIPGLGN